MSLIRGFKVRLCGSVLFFLVMMACDSPPKTDGHLRIATTTGMIGDLIQHIVGDSATVVSIMHPGVDPHLYKAGQRDLKHLIDADIIFYNGLHLEGKLGTVLERVANSKPVVGLGDYLGEEVVRFGEDSYDPHIWFDIALWKQVAQVALDTLVKIDTANEPYYKANAAMYLKELDALEEWVKTQIARVPPSQRTLITAHDAFGYFGRAYDVEVIGLQGISTLSDFGLRDVSELVNLIVARDIPAVFIESSVSDKAMRAVLSGVAQRGGTVAIGGYLYSDAMGERDTPEGTYIGMFKHNVLTLVEALTPATSAGEMIRE